MNDIFIEQIVKRERTMRDRVLFIVVILLVISIPGTLTLIAINTMHYLVVLAAFIFLMGVWFIWYFRSHQNIEFEYQMVQDILVVSKIIAKRKRKELLRLDTHNIDQLAKGDEPEVSKVSFVRVIDAAADSSDYENTYYAIFTHSGGSGKRALFFNPNERVLNSMKPYLKKDIVLKLFYNR